MTDARYPTDADKLAVAAEQARIGLAEGRALARLQCGHGVLC